MKQRKFTLMFIPDANRPIWQKKIPKSMLYILPFTLTAAIFSTSAWIYSEKLDYIQQIQTLETEVKTQDQQSEQIIKKKEQAIELLQKEVIHLSEHANEVKSQLDEVVRLKEEIRQISDSIFPNNPLPPDDINILSPDESKGLLSKASPLSAVGGQRIPVTDEIIQDLAVDTSERYDSLQDEIELISQQLTTVREALEEVEYIQSITPSIWPSSVRKVSSGFGVRSDPFTSQPVIHNGIDFPGDTTDTIFATAAGKVSAAGWDDQFGYYVTIDHSRGLKTIYMHLSRLLVSNGERVDKGDTIGKMGSTGRSTGTHLHYEVHRNGAAVNPEAYLP
jgi:murein DD-endopeptidase MepM/ murein hydrolase activator NlpD